MLRWPRPLIRRNWWPHTSTSTRCFQEEYRTLGYPSGEFNDRLIDAIDDLLATPDIAGSILLVQPKVVYQFADPDLEALSAGQKIMLRLGSQNAILIKTKLRAIRRELTRSAGTN